MNIIAKDDSYAERRMLFKNIWQTALQMHGKEADVKPKVIKTLRLDDDVDKISIGNSKKERIKNLRSVCKKILDFCDEQDADDDQKFYEKKLQKKIENLKKPLIQKHKKRKTHSSRRKVKNTEIGWKSQSPPIGLNVKAVTKNSIGDFDDNSSLSLPPKKKTIVNRAVITKFPPISSHKVNFSAITRRKTVKKKSKESKTSSQTRSAYALSDTPQFDRVRSNPAQFGRSVLRNVKEVLKDCKNSIIVKKDNNG